MGDSCNYDKKPTFCGITKNAFYFDKLNNVEYDTEWGKKKIYLPIFTRDLQKCAKYVGEADPDGDAPSSTYSKVPECKGGGFLCLPWCENNPPPGEERKCSSDLISMEKDPSDPKNLYTFKIDNVKLSNFDNYTFVDLDNKFTLIKPDSEDPTKGCEYLDPECAGKGVITSSGEYCDLADPSDFYITLCDSNDKCCGHGKCMNNKCECDTGYAGNCCQCADGYYPLGPNGQCIKKSDEQVLCCNKDSADLRKVKREDCNGENDIIVNSQDDCYPKTDYWCMNSDYSCGQYKSRNDWENREKQGSTRSADCAPCYPKDKYVCTEKSCDGNVVENFVENYSTDRNCGIDWGILIIIVIIGLLLLTLIVSKKKKRN